MRNWYESKTGIVKNLKLPISHEYESFEIIQKVVRSFKPHLMIELGTAYYGLTLMLHEILPKVPLFTFDIFDPRIYVGIKFKRMVNEKYMREARRAFGKSVTFITGDVVQKKNLALLSLASYDSKKLLYCDNGIKRREVIYYGPLLRKGDLLGVHDWGKEVGYFQPEVRKVLVNQFEEHPVNLELVKQRLLTRFFVRNGNG